MGCYLSGINASVTDRRRPFIYKVEGICSMDNCQSSIQLETQVYNHARVKDVTCNKLDKQF